MQVEKEESLTWVQMLHLSSPPGARAGPLSLPPPVAAVCAAAPLYAVLHAA